MIEILEDDNWGREEGKKELPKNIRQIGTPDIGDRIYIENQAYQALHATGKTAEETAYVLLGRFDSFKGRECIFIQTVVEMGELKFENHVPIWNDDAWAYLYKNMGGMRSNLIIAGWAVDLRGMSPEFTEPLERLHRTCFGGTHQVFLLMDSLEQEENFYSQKNGRMSRREGFYIYYERKEPTASLAVPEQSAREPERTEETPKRPQILAYAPSLFLMAIVVALGYSAFRNYQKMNEMEMTLSQMNTAQTLFAEESGVGETLTEGTITGNVAPDSDQIQTAEEAAQQPEQLAGETGAEPEQLAEEPGSEPNQGTELAEAGSEADETELASSEVEESAEQTAEAASTDTLTEAQLYLQQGYYVVQQGDSLVGICKKIYQTTAMLDKLCEKNGIDNPDSIYAGQYLVLPN